MTDFDYGVLHATGHRPWPIPSGPWVMTQTWHELLFAHWAVDAAQLAALVPAVFRIDRFEGQAWLGVVPFRMSNVGPRGMPALPFVSAFPELNVRTYVRVGGKPGVLFFSLDAGSTVAAATARVLLRLPYFRARMAVESVDGWIRYNSNRARGTARFEGRFRPAGAPRPPAAGSLEHFLTERYCLYALDHFSRPYRLDIHHAPWPLQPAEADIAVNTMADAAGLRVPAVAPLLHYAHRLDVVAWAPRRL